MRLNHLHLKVRSVDRARRFYETLFGLREHAWHGDVLFLRDEAGMDLALAPAEAVEPLPAWFHFGFRLGDPQAVEALYDRAAAAGAELRSPLEREPDFVGFRCADPDGYQIEVYWEP